MKVYKFVHVQMNEFPEGNVKQHSHEEFENKSNLRKQGYRREIVF